MSGGEEEGKPLSRVDVSEGTCFCPVSLPAPGASAVGALSGGLRAGGNGNVTSPRQETPVPSMVTLHTAHTGAFFRKAFSLKLCGSAFLGCGRNGRQIEV